MRDSLKKLAALKAVEMVESGHTLGLGTGSTAAFAIEALGEMVSRGLSVKGVPTSLETEGLARRAGIPLVNINDVPYIDLTIDGADEVDPNFNLIKGGGGALTREKLVAIFSKHRVIIADDSKLVNRLGHIYAVPVEVLPFAWRPTSGLLDRFGCACVLRSRSGNPFVTDNGNYIVDCRFDGIENPGEVERSIKQVPGVVEVGLFTGLADTVIIGRPGGAEVLRRVSSPAREKAL